MQARVSFGFTVHEFFFEDVSDAIVLVQALEKAVLLDWKYNCRKNHYVEMPLKLELNTGPFEWLTVAEYEAAKAQEAQEKAAAEAEEAALAASKEAEVTANYNLQHGIPSDPAGESKAAWSEACAEETPAPVNTFPVIMQFLGGGAIAEISVVQDEQSSAKGELGELCEGRR